MCLIFIALKQHPRFKTVIAANRDEFYKRRTAAASWWTESPSIVGGRDLEAGGTWLGMNKNGRISMVTNFRDPKNIRADAPSRGHLVSDYLQHSSAPKEYMEKLSEVKEDYNGFNLLVGNQDFFLYQSNYAEGIRTLDSGIYGLSNHLLDTPWPKVKWGKEAFKSFSTSKDLSGKLLFEFLYNDRRASDELLPDTGIGLERERALSSMFIKTNGYGTRCSTVILIDNDNNVSFAERVYDTNTFDFIENSFQFQIPSR